MTTDTLFVHPAAYVAILLACWSERYGHIGMWGDPMTRPLPTGPRKWWLHIDVPIITPPPTTH